MFALGAALAFAQTAGAVGLLVVKGANGSPEFAKVIPFSQCRQFPASYTIQVPGGSDMVITRDQIFGAIEYDPNLLNGDLISSQDFEPLTDVAAKTQEMGEKFPAVKRESERFLKSINEALNYRDQGLVHFRGRWISKKAYESALESIKREEEVARERAAMEEQRRAETIAQREAAGRAMVAAEEAKRAQEERERMAVERDAKARERREEEERQQREAIAERERQAEAARREVLMRNYESLGAGPLEAALKTEAQTIAARYRQSESSLQAFECAPETSAQIFNLAFPTDEKELPAFAGNSMSSLSRKAQDGKSRLLWLSSIADQGKHAACVVVYDVPLDSSNMILKGPQTDHIVSMLDSVAHGLSAKLPRAVAACMATLGKSGAMGMRVPLADEHVTGYITMTRPALGDDGSYHTMLIIGLGLSAADPAS